MSGVRIYELAKEYGVPNKALIDMLGGMGYPVKSHSSSIDMHLADRLRRQIKQKGLEKPRPKKPAKATAKTTAKGAAPKTAKPAKKAATKKAETPAKIAVDKKAPAPAQAPAQKPVVKKTEAKPKTAASKQTAPEKTVKIKKKVARLPLFTDVVEEKPRHKPATSRKAPAQAEPAKAKTPADRPVQKELKTKKPFAVKKGRFQKGKQETKRPAHGTASKETSKKRREDDAVSRKVDEEERELQMLIEEEERAKREVESRRIVIDEATTVREFAEKVHLGVNEIIGKLIGKGFMATLNQTIDADMAKEMASELGFEIKMLEEKEQDIKSVEEEDIDKLITRPPVVTIMGHVDHGKTSLLDTIRKTKVTEGEAGGITQRVGAYRVELPKGTVVFLDTPGHEAFTAMRARGVSVTDIVILVVAADDGVMPQTIEAIHHARAANVPVLVAINKIDKPGADPDRIRQDLSGHQLVSEKWGGDTIFCEVSAKSGVGIDNLLEMILLQAEILELKANPDRMAAGAIIESKLDKGRGPVATVLVHKGTLKVGDAFVTGSLYGRVRAIIDDQGQRKDSAGPSMPVEILGFSGVPDAGESFIVYENERKAHQIALKRQDAERVKGLTTRGHVRLENLHAQITKGNIKDLNIIIKADAQGSIEAVQKALDDIKIETVRINVLHGAVGGITETDISLATASDAIVIGFNVRPTEKANDLANEEEVDVRLYRVIYQAIDDIKSALVGMLEPVYKEIVTGRAEVRQTYNISKVGAIAGCYVTSGKATRNSSARLIRDDMVIHTGKITSLKRFKDDAKEVANGYECGIGLEKYNDIKLQDVIEMFKVEEVERQN
ncbi:Translation initiation factor 2 [hydrothermal vent metagenome]|uniref:Translation initiation factor 2 n=1 Tax=hydrothermal vent metagenome TaxID=652676 RepID=A0A3B1CLV8_9ZZZZ